LNARRHPPPLIQNGTDKQERNMSATAEKDTIVERGIEGEVKFYNQADGWGFVRLDDGREVFVHHTGIRKEDEILMLQSTRLRFDIASGHRGLKCVNVKMVN
jgi:CspA family cold shock protein